MATIGLNFYLTPHEGLLEASLLEARFDGGYIQIASTVPAVNQEPEFFIYGFVDKKSFEIDKKINSIYDALAEANKWWAERLPEQISIDQNGKTIIRNESGEIIGRQG